MDYDPRRPVIHWNELDEHRRRLTLLFGKSLRQYVLFARGGMIAILAMGLARFLVGITGIPYQRATHLVSLTVITVVLLVYYGQKAAATSFGGYRHLLPLTFLLSATMYGFIVVALLVEGLGGFHGYFHSPGSGFAPAGMDVATHIGGQLLAWLLSIIPLFWPLMCLGYFLSRYLRFLWIGFLILAATGVLRMLVGAVGVPYSTGTWISSLSLASMVLAFYYGYRAPSNGFTGYAQMIPVGLILSATKILLVLYGILVATSLGIPNYFHAPGEGFQPGGMTISQHMRGHLIFDFSVGAVLKTVLAVIGFSLARRKASVPTPETV